ncbi:hypothetical protein [Demequina sp. NBRC 110054]|uniref:hypothetical protein n=1 Tax=Demequina sp. NBRC 110054 TaxID=1570343 RepID=UPI000A069D62|nr:hypothetical protein [Demequina sp. NBRC 110054]
MSTTPDWHEDPTAPGSGRQRYWDGAQWTDWVMDPGATEARALPVADAQAEAAAAPTQQMPAAEPSPTTTSMPTSDARESAGAAPQSGAQYAAAPGQAPVGQQPAEKSKAPMIIGIVVGVILLIGVGGVILAGLLLNKASDTVSDALDDLAASASSGLDDWESWAAEITEDAEDLEEAFGDLTADPSVTASWDAWPDGDDPEETYLWVLDLWDTGLDEDTQLEAGYWVCEQFEGGATDSYEDISQLLTDTSDRYGVDEWVAAGVMSAAIELCPDWTDALNEAWG